MIMSKTPSPAKTGRANGLAALALVLALGLLGAACGSGDDQTTAEPDVTTTTTGDATTTTDGAASTDGSTTEAAADSVCDTVPTKTEGVLSVATGQEVYPPWMEDNDPANGKGFESALVHSLAQKMGIDVIEWSGTGFAEAIVAGEKNYDFNIQQFSISDERDQVVDFSNGYYTVDQAIVGASDGPAAQAKSLADLKELRLGAALGTTSLNYIEDVIQPTSDAAVYDDNAQATAAFNAGQVDAIVYDLPTAYYITSVELPDASIIGVLPQGGSPEELGMLFEEGSPLVDCVNTALAALVDDGTLASLQQEWLYDGGSIPALTN